MNAMAKVPKTKLQTSIWSTLAANKLLVALALIGIAVAAWQLWRR
jgi:hypothetical protein